MKKFTRRIEDFTCEHCGTHVSGNGYTNHCPQCLYSKHVDNNPGDRESNCGGMMRPVSIESKKDYYIITHRCEKCGKEIRQRSSENDNIDALIAISMTQSAIFSGR